MFQLNTARLSRGPKAPKDALGASMITGDPTVRHRCSFAALSLGSVGPYHLISGKIVSDPQGEMGAISCEMAHADRDVSITMATSGMGIER